MSRFVPVGLVALASFGLFAMSSCMMVSGPGGFGSSPTSSYLFGGGSNSTLGNLTGTHSLFGGSTYGRSSNSTANSSYASSTGSSSGGTVPPGYSPDSSESSALSSYLQSHRLPLVGAQVLTNDSGNSQVILYGFVATDFGKEDAANKARRYLHDPSLAVINRIAVRPQLLASGSGGSTAAPSMPPPPPSSGAYGGGNIGGVQSYENQTAQSQQYMQNQSGLAALIPLISMMGMLSFGNGGVGMGYGGYPPYGSPFGMPYSPYGMGSYGSPFAPGFGGYGGGFTFP